MALLRPSFPAVSLSITAAFFLATFITYGFSLHNRFVSWDDTLLIVDNPIVQSMSPTTITKAFTSYDPELYIPLTFVSYQISHLIGGDEPFVYHLTDLVLHTSSAILVAWLLWLLVGNGWLALGLGMIFAMHPLNTEAVAWASGRKDVLSLFFFLNSLVTYLYAVENEKRSTYIASVILFILSLLAKVMTVTGPVVLILLDVLRGRPLTRRVWLEKLPFIAASIVFGIVGLFGKSTVLVSTTPVEKILMAAKSTVFYLQKFLWPSDLSVVYPYTKTITVTSPDFFVPLAIVLVILAAAIFAWNRFRPASIALAFVLVTLLPTFINIAKGGDVYFASDRYFYLPMIGVLMLIGFCLRAWMQSAITVRDIASRPKIIAGFFAGLLLTFGVLAHKQAAIWSDSVTLYQHALAIYPESRAAQNNLGMERFLEGRTDEAIELFRAALEVHDDPRTQVNLAAAMVQRGDTEQALAIFQSVISTDPGIPDSYYGIGNILQKQGKFLQAADQYRKAIDIDPTYLNAYNNLGGVYIQLHDWTHAIETLQKTIELKPDFVESYYNLGLAYEQTGDLANAEKYYRKAIELNENDADAMANLAALLYDRGLTAEAVPYLQRALKVDPSNPSAVSLVLRLQHDGVIR